MKKRDKLYKVTVYELTRGGNHEDRTRKIGPIYKHAYSSKQAVTYIKKEHPEWKGYDNCYGSESVDYMFVVERDLGIRKPKKVVQLNLFDFIDNKD